MADVAMVATIVAFVLVCVAYVEWCDRIVRRDQPSDDAATIGEIERHDAEATA